MWIRGNMGPADRLVRLVVGGSLVAFGGLGLFPGTWGLVVPGVGAVVALTGLIGYCPLYRLFRLGWRAAPATAGPDGGSSSSET